MSASARATILALMFLSFAGSALAQDRPAWYVGGAFGRLHVDGDYADQLGRVAPGEFGPIIGAHAEPDRKRGGRAFAGWRLAPRFSLELDYADLGSIRQQYVIPGPTLNLNIPNLGGTGVLTSIAQDFFLRDGRSRIDAIGFSAVGAWPVAERFSLLGRAGIARTRLRYEESGIFSHATINGETDPPSFRFSQIRSPQGTYAHLKQTRPLLSLGLGYRLTDRLALRAEWTRYFGIGRNYERDVASLSSSKGKFDVDLAAIGASFDF